MNKSILILLLALYLTGCAATSNKHFLKVETTPSDALVSVHQSADVASAQDRQVAGTTPVEKNFEFGKNGQLWLEIERRGYAPHIEKVLPEDGQVSVNLEKIKNRNGEFIPEYTFPEINQIGLVMPDIKIYERGFSSETLSEEKSKLAQEELVKGINNFFSNKNKVVAVESSDDNKKLLRAVWRDVRSSMELLDPIRLRYMAEPPLLETKSSRKAAKTLGTKYKTEVMLFIKGKQNIETAGMVAGKIGMTVVGTATSYAGSYSRAVSNGDSFFVYNVYIPNFAEGTLLKAALIDCSNGEILWINSGLWGPISFGAPNTLKNVLSDLFAGIDQN